jgi:hypothetical protein
MGKVFSVESYEASMANNSAPSIHPPPSAPAEAKTVISARLGAKQVILRKHFNLFYWWPVWLYAAVAAFITLSFGVDVKMVDAIALKETALGAIDAKTVRVFTEPWLAIGFFGLILFVAIFTSLRATGAMAMVLVLGLIVTAVAISWTVSWAWVFTKFPLLRVYVNQGGYAGTFVVLFPVWVATTFFFNKLHYLRFRPGRQVADVRPFGGGETSIASHTLQLTKRPEDVFVHRILGLWWLGLGTADIVVSYTKPDGGAHVEVFENVINPNRKIAAIQGMLK